jgi:cell division initiation protein
MPNSIKSKGIRRRAVVLSLAGDKAPTYVCPPRKPRGGIEMADRLTAMEIEKQEFSKKLRGFDPDEVQLYLRSVASEVERLTLENSEFLEELGLLRQAIEESADSEKALREALVSAQRMSEEIKNAARTEAELVVKEARLRGEEIVKHAHNTLNQIEMDISRSKIERETLEHRLRSVIDQHLAMLEMQRQARADKDNLRVMPKRVDSEVG